MRKSLSAKEQQCLSERISPESSIGTKGDEQGWKS